MTTDQVHARHMLATSLVTGLDHVGIAVADLDVAIEWYHDHLGMILVHEEINDDQASARHCWRCRAPRRKSS